MTLGRILRTENVSRGKVYRRGRGPNGDVEAQRADALPGLRETRVSANRLNRSDQNGSGDVRFILDGYQFFARLGQQVGRD
jgi:hypothetical protein